MTYKPSKPPPLPSQIRGESDLISSAQAGTIPPTQKVSGSIDLNQAGISAAFARQVLVRLFLAQGFAVDKGKTFAHGGAVIALDGFDPTKKVGFVFVSREESGVVTSYDAVTEQAIADANKAGAARLLILHDRDIANTEQLMARAQQFLAQAPSSSK